jgi:NTE family protein
MMTELRLEIDRPDVIIRPDVHKYGLFDAVSPKELIRAGYLAAKDAVPEIRKALSWSISIRRILSQSTRNGRPKIKAPCKPIKPEDIHTRVIK